MMYSGPELADQQLNFKVRSIASGSQCRILTLTLKFRTAVIFSDLFVPTSAGDKSTGDLCLGLRDNSHSVRSSAGRRCIFLFI